MDGCEPAFKKKKNHTTRLEKTKEVEKKEWKKWLLLSRLAQLQVFFLKKKKRGTDGFKAAEKSRKVARVVPFGYLLVCFFSVSSNQTTAQPSKPIDP